MNFSSFTESQLIALVANENADSSALKQCVGLSYATDRLIAKHSNATQDVLERLSESSDYETRKNVICNAGTQADLLIALAPEFPMDFFSHPLLDLMILEDPQLLQKLKPGVLKAFLKADDCPNAFIQWASRHGTKGDQLEILKRDDLTVAVLKSIANGAHPKPSERAIDHLLEFGETW